MTLSEFQSWALSQGQVGKYDDGGYVGQCVSLINQYCYRVLNVPAKAWGNAKDWPSNSSVQQYFDQVNDLQVGDIVVYGANFGGGVGHIAISLGNGQILEQNGRQALDVAVGAIYNGYIAVLRHKGGTPGGQVSNPVDILRIVAYEIEGYGLDAAYGDKYDKNLQDAWGAQPIENFIRHGYQEATKNGTLKVELHAQIDTLTAQVADLKKQLADAQSGDYIKVTDLYVKKG